MWIQRPFFRAHTDAPLRREAKTASYAHDSFRSPSSATPRAQRRASGTVSPLFSRIAAYASIGALACAALLPGVPASATTLSTSSATASSMASTSPTVEGAQNSASFREGTQLPTTSPVTITDSVTDPQGFFTRVQRASIADALKSLGVAGVDTYVVLVPNLSGQAPISWCEASGKASGLSASSLVLVLAYEQRSITTCGNSGKRGIADSAVVTALNRAKKILGKADPLDAETGHEAVLAFAESLTSTKLPGGSQDNAKLFRLPTSEAFPFLVITFTVGVFVLAGFIIFIGRNKTARRASDSYKERAAAALAELSSKLLQADEIVRSSHDDIEFARAQFGATSTQEFDRLLATAESTVRSAFIDQQRLSSLPPLEQIREAERISAQLDQVIPPLIAERERMSDERQSQASAGQQAQELLTIVDEAIASLPGVRMEIDGLAATYSRELIASLLDNPDQARPLLDHARMSVLQGLQLADSAPAEALRHIAVARHSLTVAQRYIDAVHTAPADLEQASEHLNQAIASITSDIADVSRLGADPAAFAPLVTDAQSAVTRALAARDGRDDVLAALESLRIAEDALDRALEPLRSAEESQRKQEGSASRMVEQAQSSVARAQQFLQANRYVIPQETRTTVARAEGALERARAALTTRDFQAASLSAQEALTLAEGVLRTPVQSSPLGDPSAQGVNGIADSVLWSVLLSGALGGHSRHHGSDDMGWGNFGGSFGTGGFGGGGLSGGGFGGSGGSGHTSSF